VYSSPTASISPWQALISFLNSALSKREGPELLRGIAGGGELAPSNEGPYQAPTLTPFLLNALVTLQRSQPNLFTPASSGPAR
jgi:hypothetical protein